MVIVNDVTRMWCSNNFCHLTDSESLRYCCIGTWMTNLQFFVPCYLLYLMFDWSQFHSYVILQGSLQQLCTCTLYKNSAYWENNILFILSDIHLRCMHIFLFNRLFVLTFALLLKQTLIKTLCISVQLMSPCITILIEFLHAVCNLNSNSN